MHACSYDTYDIITHKTMLVGDTRLSAGVDIKVKHNTTIPVDKHKAQLLKPNLVSSTHVLLCRVSTILWYHAWLQPLDTRIIHLHCHLWCHSWKSVFD